MERKKSVREANIFYGKDVKLGWIYDSSKRDYNPPKTDKYYNSSENRKYVLDICTKNDKVKYKNFDNNKDKPWYKDFCNTPASETIHVYGSAEIERKASEAISYEQGQEIVTSLLNKIEIDILIFLNKDLLNPFETGRQLKCFLDYILEEKKEAILPDCLKDGVFQSIIYKENQRVPNNLMYTLKEGCRILKTTTFEKAKSVYSMEGKLHDTMLKEQLLLNDSQNRKPIVAEAILNSVNKKEVDTTNQASEKKQSATLSAFEYSKIDKDETTKMIEAITNRTKIDSAGIVENQNKGMHNISHNTKESENHTTTFSGISTPKKEVEISPGKEGMHLNHSKGSCNDIPDQENQLTKQEKCAPIEHHKTKDKKQEPGTVTINMMPTINSDHIPENAKSSLSQNMNESKKQMTKYPENDTSSKVISISSGIVPQELNTSKESCSYIRSQENLNPKQEKSPSIEHPGTKDKEIEPAGKVKNVLKTKNLDHMSVDRTDIHSQNVGKENFVAIHSEKVISESHESKALGIVYESGKIDRDDDTKSIGDSKNTDYTVGQQKCIIKADDTKLNATKSEIISKSLEPKNRKSVNEVYNLSSNESNIVHNINDKSLNTNESKSCAKIDLTLCQVSQGSLQNHHIFSSPSSTNNSQDEHYNRCNKMDKGTNLLRGNISSTRLKSAASEANSSKEDKSQCKPSLNSSTSNVSTTGSNFFETLDSKSKIIDSCGVEKHCYGSFLPESEEKVILLLGASGSGKTTLVNFVANYFEEVKTPDEKMVLINPNLSSSKQSSTKKITSHSFSSEKENGLVFTFIDTPGLNDSSGAEVRDHVQSLKTFLANMNANNLKIHALGFVVQAHLVRLTSSERLVMDYVSTLFGEKVKDNIITFVTFADNQENPPVVEAIENYGLKTKHFLKFNNSILSANTYVVDDLDRVYWRKGYKSLKKCIKLVKDMPPLCVNAMKALQNEIHSKTVVEGVMRDLEAEILVLLRTVQKEKSREQIRKTSNLVWELAMAAFYQIKQSNYSYNSVDEFLREVTVKLCQKKSVSSQDCLKYLTLASNRGMKPAALSIIYSLSMVYNILKKSSTETRTLAKKVKTSHSAYCFVLFCHGCDKEHLLERIPKGSWGWNNDREVKLKCKSCYCPGEVHGVNTNTNGNNDLSISKLLEHARSGLSHVIGRYSIPSVQITDEELLEFLLEEVDDKYKLFIKDLLLIIKNTV